MGTDPATTAFCACAIVMSGSDLWRGPGDPADEFWMVTDRGPNGQVRVDGANRRTFPIPAFAPVIVKVRASGSTLSVMQTLPIVGRSGKPVGGLSNVEGRDETPYDFAAKEKIAFDPNGLDPEGLVRTSSGEFWLAEEYSPSLVRVDSKGMVVKRYVPAGVKLAGADYPVAETLPAVYAKRKGNRGFEGLALSRDERTLYIVLQSPLLIPDSKTGDASRNTRILAFDIAGEKVVAEYVYRLDPVGEFDPKQAGKPQEMKVSGVVSLNASTLLVLERTDDVAKLYTVTLGTASSILGTKWDDAATSPSLESLVDTGTEQVVALPKTLVIDLSALQGMPGKIEGVAVISRDRIAVANDNDFDIGDFDAEGNNKGKGVKSQLLYLSLSRALPD